MSSVSCQCQLSVGAANGARLKHPTPKTSPSANSVSYESIDPGIRFATPRPTAP
jgi:hypothetical protein